MSGLIGRKIGMTSVFKGNAHVPVTVIEFEPNVITQIRTEENDGYSAVQLSVIDKKEKHTSKALQGHFAKASSTPKRYSFEIRNYVPDGANIGDTLKVEDIFTEGTLVDVIGTSKGKGFQGVVKRHGFRGVGGQTHGQHNRERAPGSIGQSSDPSRVFKGVKMGGQMGNVRVKQKNLAIVEILPESGLMLVQGAVPGPTNSIVRVHTKNKVF